MSESSASLDTGFMGTALVSLGFYGGIRSLERGIQVSRASLLSRGFSERYPVSWGREVSSVLVFFQVLDILLGVPLREQLQIAW